MALRLCFQIFWVFFKISVVSFGGVFGVLPQLERELVVAHSWLTHDQFIQSYVLAQVAPGPNMVMCSMIGYKIAGWSGFAAAFAGIYFPTFLIMGAAYLLYHRYRSLAVTRRIELAIRPLVVGLLSASALELWYRQSASMPMLAILLTVAGIALTRLRVDPLLILFGSGAVTLLAGLLG